MLSVGLLHPITIDPSRSLLAGVRRLGAARRLGWDTVPCVVVDSVGDLWRALEVERDENTCRKDFTRSEAVEMARRIEALERPGAADREKAGVKLEPSENFSEGSAGARETKVKAARAVGMSRPTYERAGAIIDAAAADPEKYRDI